MLFLFFIVSLGFHLCICVREVSRGAACLRADGDLQYGSRGAVHAVSEWYQCWSQRYLYFLSCLIGMGDVYGLCVFV